MKIAMRLLKTNISLISNSQNNELKIVYLSICKDFSWICNLLSNDSSIEFATTTLTSSSLVKIANIQMLLIAELQKMFPELYRGAFLLKTFIGLESLYAEYQNSSALKDLKSDFRSLLIQHRDQSTNTYLNYFELFENDDDLIYLLSFSSELMKEILDTNKSQITTFSMTEDSNLFLQMIQLIAKNPQIVHQSPLIYDQTIFCLSSALSSGNLHLEPSRYIVLSLIKKMLAEDYWTSIICYDVLQQFLSQLTSTETLVQYFIAFDSLLQQTEIMTETNKIAIKSILKRIIKSHPKVLQSSMINPETIHLLTGESSCENNFKETFLSLINSPSATNYKIMIKCLSLQAKRGMDVLNNKEIIKFLDVMRLRAHCDWNLHSDFVANVMNVMMATENPQNKMLFMLKFSQSLSLEIPQPLQVKLLDLLFSYIPLLKSKIGLPDLIGREINKMLDSDDITIVRMVLRKFEKNICDPQVLELTKAIEFDGNISTTRSEEELTLLLTKMRNFKSIHKCLKSPHKAVENKVVEDNDLHLLQKILKYSEWIQTQTISTANRSLVENIVRNFKKSLHAESFKR